MKHAIIDRGRGPEIAGSRITVYDVFAETQAGATAEQLAEWYKLEIAQIQLALQYIADHHEEVRRDYQAIKDRHARGNPPDTQAKLDAIQAKYAPFWEERKRRTPTQEENGAWPPRGY